jgi:hypothetical protein
VEGMETEEFTLKASGELVLQIKKKCYGLNKMYTKQILVLVMAIDHELLTEPGLFNQEYITRRSISFTVPTHNIKE